MKIGEFLRDSEGNEFFIKINSGKIAILDGESKVVFCIENEDEITKIKNLVVELLDIIKE